MKLLNKIAERLGYTPKQEMSAMVKLKAREFAGAAINRLTNDWVTYSSSADSILRMNLKTLRARCRDLSESNDYAQKYLTMLKDNVLGDCGMTFKAKAHSSTGGPLKRFNKLVEQEWKAWGKQGVCTVDGKHSWPDVQSLMLESLARDGECLLRKIRGWKNNRFGYAVQMLESDLLDLDFNQPGAGDANEIRMGVEIDRWGKPVNYYLRENYENDLFYHRTTRDRVKVPARDIIHIYAPRRIGQTRGYPWMATTMLRLKMLGGYEEAELVASRAAASKMAFIISQGEHDYTGEEIHSGKVMDAEPGSIEQLLQGQDIKVVDWNHPNSQYPAFTKGCLRGVAAGLNLSYPSLSGDLEAVNFSSTRAGQGEERNHYRKVQRVVSGQLCVPLCQDWLLYQGGTGRIVFDITDEVMYESEWHGRRWDWVDPTKDITAKIQEINAGLTSLQRALAERGIELDDLIEEIKSDQDKIKAAGLTLPEIYQALKAMGDESLPEEEEEQGEKEETEETSRLLNA